MLSLRRILSAASHNQCLGSLFTAERIVDSHANVLGGSAQDDCAPSTSYPPPAANSNRKHFHSVISNCCKHGMDHAKRQPPVFQHQSVGQCAGAPSQALLFANLRSTRGAFGANASRGGGDRYISDNRRPRRDGPGEDRGQVSSAMHVGYT